MTSDEDDVAREREDQIPEGSGKRALSMIAAEIIERQNEIAGVEENLSLLKARLRELEYHEMPNAMAALNASSGINDFKFNNGVRVAIKDDVQGSIPKEQPQRQEAIDYLLELGGESLYKTTVSVAFGRRQHNEALSLAGELRDKGYEVEVDTTVHHTSLAAWAREMIAKGNDDLDWLRLGLVRFRKAKLTLPRNASEIKF